jgi:hypothetical protein
MNATEAINRIKDLLGYSFNAEKFFTTKLVDGETEVTNNKDKDSLEIGDELFVMKDSVLIPAPAGSHETRDGIVVEVSEDGTITKIESRVEEAETAIENEKTDMMSSAVLADGTKIETDEEGELKPGQKLYVITKEGERVSAPEGEHTTQSGITIVVDGSGVITGVKYPDDKGEGSLKEELKDLKKMKEAMSEMVGLLTELNKFKSDFESIKADFEEFKKQPDRMPVVEKKFSTQESVLDWKLNLIKNAIKK